MATVERMRSVQRHHYSHPGAANGSARPPESNGSESPLWTAHEVADLLGVSQEYVWQLSRERRIPTVSLGRARRYRPESVLA